MWMIDSSTSYLITVTNSMSFSILSGIVAFIMSVPSSKHYLQISQVQDFDFINVFLQSSILKTAIFGTITLILTLSIYLLLS